MRGLVRSHIKLNRRIRTSIFVKEKCSKASIGRISNRRGIKAMVLRKKAPKTKSESFTTHFIKDFVHFSGECVEIAVAKGFSFTASYVFQVWFLFRKVLADPYYNDAYIFCLEKEKKLTFWSHESRMIMYSDVLNYTGSERTVFTG